MHIIDFGGFNKFSNIIFLLYVKHTKSNFYEYFLNEFYKTFPWVVRLDNVRVFPI